MAALTLASLPEIVTALRGRRFVSAELMYLPRPAAARERRVFDFTLASRLEELSRYERAAVVFVCDSPATADSLAHLPGTFPHLLLLAVEANPAPLPAGTPDAYAATPLVCGWNTPDRWRRYNLTDRWARLRAALDLARQLDTPGWLILPAHDAVWGRGLLARLVRLGEQHARNGQPAAVSPYTPYQHFPVPGVDIPRDVIDALNAAFARDSWRRWRFRSEGYQAFWGKMGLLPFGLCDTLLQRSETMVWEDDLEFDRVIREAGYAARALWVGSPALYHQSPPVFDHDGLRAVIDRTLHYSLCIPGAFPAAKSDLNRPLDTPARLRAAVSPRFARAVALSERLIADCNATIAARVDRCGASWVDWGAYRYVAQVGDPLVQVWKSDQILL